MNADHQTSSRMKEFKQRAIKHLIFITILGFLPGIVHHQLPDRFALDYQTKTTVNKDRQEAIAAIPAKVEVVDVAENEQIGDTENSGDTQQVAVNDTEIEQLTESYGAPGAGYPIAPVSASQYGSAFHFPPNRHSGSGGHRHSGGGSHHSSSGGGSVYHNTGGYLNSTSLGGYGGGSGAPSGSGGNNNNGPGPDSPTTLPAITDKPPVVADKNMDPAKNDGGPDEGPMIVADNAAQTPGTTSSPSSDNDGAQPGNDTPTNTSPPESPQPADSIDPTNRAINAFHDNTFLSLFLLEIGGTLVDGQAPDENQINTGTDSNATEYDQVNVFGEARISTDASIVVNLKDTYSPQVGEFFDIITGDKIITNLDTIDFQLPTLEALGFDYQIVTLIDRLTGTERQALRLSIIAIESVINTGLQVAATGFQILDVGNPIPEPASWLLMMLGLLLFSAMHRYRKL